MSRSLELKRTFEQGVAQHRAGQVGEAERCYRRVLAQDERHEQALFLVAAIALETERAPEALGLLKRLVQLHPTNANYFTNLGEAHRRVGDDENAANALVRAVALNPDLAQAHFNLGLVTRNLGELDTALQAFERAAELKPESAQIQHTFARALSNRGEHARAVGHFQCALVQNPNSPELLTDYAICLRKLKRLPAALRAVERALELSANSALAHHERSAVLTEQGNFDQARLSAERALALEPDYPDAWCDLAAACVFNGQLEAGLAAYRRAIALDPNNALTHSNLAFLLAFDPNSSAQAILNEVQEWARRHAAPFARYLRPHRHRPDPERKLRLGYVSSNFNDHCQALFTLPLLDAHDRSKFELHAFSALSSSDRMTDELRAKFDHWTDLTGLDAIEASDRIRSQEIDILIDLTMHMSITQLRIFACKPAPVQIAWLAYPGTTGLPTIDYRITDRHLDPSDRPSDPYSEESLVLPDTFWCYRPGVELPVADLPARSSGHVTFGCLNSFWKLNDATLRLWATVLERVPDSRLLLLAPEGSARARVLATLELAGVAAERIEFSSRRPRAQYLQLYDRIDICLDALPYNGHTTSLDAFWMGVPVLTLVGQTVVGRAGLSQAMNLGLPQLITHTPEAFADSAARLAGDLEALAELRAGLRQRLEKSPLMDGAAFARNLEAKYRETWQRWCAGVERAAALSGSAAR